MKALFLLCLVYLSTAINHINGNSLGSNYSVGNISQLLFPNNQSLLFRNKDVFGYINNTNGEIMKAYHLQNNQKMFWFGGYSEIAIQINKSLNMFYPQHDQYIRSPVSDQLEKLQFNDIIQLRRILEKEVILTDKYLVLNRFNINKQKKETNFQFQILYQLKNSKQKYISILTRFIKRNNKMDQMQIGLGSYYQQNNQQYVCVLFINQGKQQDRKCGKNQKKQTITHIIGPNSDNSYILQYQQKIVIVDKDFKIIQQYQNHLIAAYSFQQKALKKQNGLIKFKSEKNTIFIFNQNDRKTIYLAEIDKNLLKIKKQNKYIVTINSQTQSAPTKIWSKKFRQIKNENQTSQYMNIYVYYPDGKLICYKVIQQNQKYQLLWKLHVSDNQLTEKQKKQSSITPRINIRRDFVDQPKNEHKDHQKDLKKDIQISPKKDELPPASNTQSEASKTNLVKEN